MGSSQPRTSAAATAAQSAVERHVDASFAFIPDIRIGDRMSFSGRDALGLPAVVVDDISYEFTANVPNLLRASGSSIARTLGKRSRRR
jgi:hypothetical protein